MNGDLLTRIPAGAALSALLRLLLAGERREEFVGDLVEEAHRDLAGSTPAQVAWWLWGQTLRSVPALVALRVRSLVAARPLPSRGITAVLAGPRGGHRSWSLPVALSVSAHIVALTLVLTWVFSHVEELEPTRIPVVFGTLLAPPPPDPAPPPVAPEPPPEPHHARAVRRPVVVSRVVSPPPAPEAIEPIEPIDAPVTIAAGRGHSAVGCVPRCTEAPVHLPPRVAEKRCLSCPQPHLTPVYVRLGLEQVLLVKTCVDVRGSVSSVDVVQGLDARADAGVKATVRGWTFSPHLLDGHPVPFCYDTRFIFSMR
jgi:hypothetical protein